MRESALAREVVESTSRPKRDHSPTHPPKSSYRPAACLSAAQKRHQVSYFPLYFRLAAGGHEPICLARFAGARFTQLSMSSAIATTGGLSRATARRAEVRAEDSDHEPPRARSRTLWGKKFKVGLSASARLIAVSKPSRAVTCLFFDLRRESATVVLVVLFE